MTLPIALEIFSGDSIEQPLALTSGDGPADLSGAAIVMRLTRSRGGVATLEVQAEITDAAGGEALIILPPEQTAGLTGQYQCEIFYSNDSQRKTVFDGVLIAKPTIKEPQA